MLLPKSALPAVFALALPASAACAAGAAGAASAARLPPAWDQARCGRLEVDAGQSAGAPGQRHAADMAVTLARPGSPDDPAAHLHAHALRTDGPASLDALPVLFAGGVLIGLESHRPPACDLTHAFRQAAITLASLPPGVAADQRWTGIRARAGENDLAFATLRLHAEIGAGGIMHVAQHATGVSGAGNDMTATPIDDTVVELSAPRARLAAIAAGGALRPDDTVMIDRIAITGEDASITAHGEIRPANRSGRLTVHARNMEAIKDALPADERERAGAAFLVLRLAARHDDDGTLRWDVQWEDRLVTVNGVPVPIEF